MNALRLSVADLGTNTLKITHAEIAPDGSITELADIADTIRIGKGIESTGRIDPARIDRCVTSLREQESIGHALGSQVFLGVATEAIRIAANGEELLGRIAHETAWQVRLISGDEEARLTFLGLADRLRSRGTSLIVDIGGGSSEFVLARDGEMTGFRSLDLGSGRLADRFFKTDPPGTQAIQASVAAARGRLDEEPDLPSPPIDEMIFSGGNGVFLETLAGQIFPHDPLDRHVVQRLLDHLALTPAADTASRLGIVDERARVLPAGVGIAMACLQAIDPSTVRTVPSGIRPGLIREYLTAR